MTISDIERGKVGVSAVDLALIARKLGQPLVYFFPWFARNRFKKEDLNLEEMRLIEAFSRIENFSLEKAIIRFVEDLGEFAIKGDIRRYVEELAESGRRLIGKDNP